jgi:CDGSH-type Zn-finger protein
MLEIRPEQKQFATIANQRYIEFMLDPKIAQRSPFVQNVKPGTYWWCACGGSRNQPFCDGSHKGTGFTPRKVEVTEGKTVAWCGCKHSANKPFCDGSHSKLP